MADDLVQLGPREVAAATLAGPGGSVADALPRAAEVHDHLARSGLPLHGWRLVWTSPAGDVRSFAAPLEAAQGTWALLEVVERDHPIVSSNPGPLVVLPSQAVRRRGLRLQWAGPLVVDRSRPDDVVADLVNDLDVAWVNLAEDRPHVSGRLFRSEIGRWWVVSTGVARLPDLAAGARLRLPVSLSPRGPELAALPSRTDYRLRLNLMSLNLAATWRVALV